MTAPDTMMPETAASWIRTGKAVLIDMREPDEFSAAHIPMAISAPLAFVPGLLAEMDLPGDRTVIFQCQKGGRAAAACALAGGNRPVYNLAGGIEAWKAAGLPVVEAVPGAASGISIFRQVQIIVGTLVLLSILTGFAVHPAGFAVAGVFGLMLAIAGLSGWCGLAMLLRRMPWNQPQTQLPAAVRS